MNVLNFLSGPGADIHALQVAPGGGGPPLETPPSDLIWQGTLRVNFTLGISFGERAYSASGSLGLLAAASWKDCGISLDASVAKGMAFNTRMPIPTPGAGYSLGIGQTLPAKEFITFGAPRQVLTLPGVSLTMPDERGTWSANYLVRGLQFDFREMEHYPVNVTLNYRAFEATFEEMLRDLHDSIVRLMPYGEAPGYPGYFEP